MSSSAVPIGVTHSGSGGEIASRIGNLFFSLAALACMWIQPDGLVAMISFAAAVAEQSDENSPSKSQANSNEAEGDQLPEPAEEVDVRRQRELEERQRRLDSLAKAAEKEDRPAVPSFEGIRRSVNQNQITFDDIKFDMEKGQKFTRDLLTNAINELAGRRLQLKGFIRPSNRQKGLSKFIFVRDDKECCFGPTAAIYDCVLVSLADGESCDFTVRPITVEGDFFLKEFDGPDGRVWAVYRMKNGVVK
jgi:hypothetical protein